MELNPTLEKFYKSVLNFANLHYDGECIVSKDGDTKLLVDEKCLFLPYHRDLKHPKNRVVFHPLNENYVNPMSGVLKVYKKALFVNLNTRLAQLINVLIYLSQSIEAQSNVKNIELVKILSSIQEADMKAIEAFTHILKKSVKENDDEFITGLFLKANGEHKNIPYAGVAKIRFPLAKEISEKLNNGTYEAYGYKTRKKDLLVLSSIFDTLFPRWDVEDEYIFTTDNRVFRFFNLILSAGYEIASRYNRIVEMLNNESGLRIDDELPLLDVEWYEELETIYGMTREIRMIPPDNVSGTSKDKPDESKIVDNRPYQPEPSQEVYQQPTMQQPIQPMPGYATAPQQALQAFDNDPYDPNKILKQLERNPYGTAQPMMPQGYPMPMPQQGYMPPMQPQGYPQPMMPQGYPQPMPQQGYMPPMQPQGYPQPMMPQGYPQPMPQQGYPMQPQGIIQPGPLNPNFIGRRGL